MEFLLAMLIIFVIFGEVTFGRKECACENDEEEDEEENWDDDFVKPVLLVDMDGVVFDYYGHFLTFWKAQYPDRVVIPAEDIKTFYFEECYPPEYTEDIRRITCAEGFFETLPVMDGAAETLNRIMDEDRFNVFLCSTPDSHTVNHCCSSEKIRSVHKHLGERWLKRIILTHDKTLVNGDFLLDDKPSITGINEDPTWDHVVFHQPYNKHVDGFRLNVWKDWNNLESILLRWYEYNQF